uniref:Uncharacterized protein n=1 Tax=Cajanus cajan TaxID=3821 RepID=A0A151QQI1_CAJCA|nr:hypothetical protein KK1_046712 [Cajanus cajan]
MKSILRCFELVAGLKVNFFKSIFGGMGVERNVIEGFAHLLNCSVTQLPFNYLGIPLGADPRRTETWRPIISKYNKKLAKWKHKSLSMAGRVSTLS